MLIVGSNIARAFSLVLALSIVRFRNAMKETRDIGFIFLAMAIGMAMGPSSDDEKILKISLSIHNETL